jgi:hypothetical protein
MEERNSNRISVIGNRAQRQFGREREREREMKLSIKDDTLKVPPVQWVPGLSRG